MCQRIKDLGIKKSTRGCSDSVTTRLDACLLNARSTKNKIIDLLDYIVDHELDLFFFTETWLGHTARDQTIIGTLCPAGYSFLHTPRKTRRGGGVRKLDRSTLNIKQLDRVCKPLSYECLECCLTSDSTLYRTFLVHRSPTALSTLAFLDEFSDHLDETVYSGGNLIVLGDFSFHVDDTSDTTKFMDMIEAYCGTMQCSFGRHPPPQLDITSNGRRVSNLLSMTLLRVTIAPSLSWEHHVSRSSPSPIAGDISSLCCEEQA